MQKKKHKDEIAHEEAGALSKRSGSSKSKTKSIITFEFKGGHRLGLGMTASGVITEVDEDTQAEKLGIQVGWAIQTVDGQPFTEKLLGSKVTGSLVYEIAFAAQLDESASSETNTQKTAARPRQDLTDKKVLHCLTFQPGEKLGVGLTDDGKVTEVDVGEQAEKLGVKPTWILQLLDGLPFTEALLGKKATGKVSYKLTFSVPGTDAEATGLAAGTNPDDDEKLSFADIWKEGDDDGESTSDWLDGGGLKFHTTADKAFSMDHKKFKEATSTSAATSNNSEAIAEMAKKQSAIKMAAHHDSRKR